MVAKFQDKFYSIYDSKQEYVVGQSLYQEALPNHQGGFFVYNTLEEAIYADIPFKSGGLYLAPRTILKVICWGNKVEYSNGKIAFSNICPVEVIPMPKGYKTTKAAYKESAQQLQLQEKYKKIKSLQNKYKQED